MVLTFLFPVLVFPFGEEGAGPLNYLSAWAGLTSVVTSPGLHRGPQFQAGVSQQQRFPSPRLHSAVCLLTNLMMSW